MPEWIYIGKRRKKKLANECLVDSFDVATFRKGLIPKFMEFKGYMESRGTPLYIVYYNDDSLIATDKEHTAAIWDHLYCYSNGNNVTDIIMNDVITPYNRFAFDK
jgi:hypothetical protein